MRRRLTALVFLVLAGLLGANLASAGTVNDTTCRKATISGSASNDEIVAYNACRFDKLDAAVAALKASPTPSPSPSASSTPTKSATPTPSPTATPSPTPTSSPTAAPAACTNPSITFTGEGSQGVAGPDPGGYGGNGYDISAEQWGVKAGYKSTLRFCSKDSWNVTITAADDGQHAVQSYPSIRRIYHDWGKGGDFSGDPRLSRFPQLKVAFDVTSPATCAGCIYETAFDNWYNGISGSNSTEQMIWLRNQGQRPAGDPIGTATIDGRSWTVWSYSKGRIVSFVPAGGAAIDAGTVDVKAFTAYQVAYRDNTAEHDNLIGSTNVANGETDPAVGQISLGVEPVKADGQRWDFNGLRLTDN